MDICIIGAMDKEVEKFISTFNLTRNSDRHEIYVGNYKNKKIILCKSGIGKVNSAALTQYLIDKYNPKYIINSGCAGSLKEDIKIMDVIIASYVMYHDFSPIRVMEYSVPDNGKVKADENLINIACEIVNKLDITNFYVAPITSGDMFVTNSELRDDIYSRTNAYAVDMESTSIGHISKLNDIPFLIIRTISDFADGNSDFELEASNLSSRIVKEIIENL